MVFLDFLVINFERQETIVRHDQHHFRRVIRDAEFGATHSQRPVPAGLHRQGLTERSICVG